MGAKAQYLDQFGDQTQPISQWVAQANWDASSVAHSPVLQNVIPVIGLPMPSTAARSGTADQFYQAFAAGTYDSVLQDMVKAWASNGFKSQIWRTGWEMNGSSMPSYAGNDTATQADWVKAFQHIYTVLHAAGQADGVNVQVMWNPDVMNYSNAGNVIQTAYPGSQYIDIIAADVYADLYPYGDHSHLYDWDKSGQVLNSSQPVFDTSLQQWAADPVNLLHYYTNPASNQWSLDGSAGHGSTFQQFIALAKSTGKALAIAETGAGNNADGEGVLDNPTFVQWLSQTLQQSGVNVSFVNIWDSYGGGNYQFSNATNGKPLEAAAWAKYFGSASAVIGPAPIVIETSGSTSLTELGKNYYLFSNSTGSGPELKYAGAAVTAGRCGFCGAVGGGEKATAHEEGWEGPGGGEEGRGEGVGGKGGGGDKYWVGTLNSSGNSLESTAVLSGTSATFEQFDPSFHQDLKGDGVIGIPATTTVIDAAGATSLVQISKNFFLNSISGGTGPALKYGGAPGVGGPV